MKSALYADIQSYDNEELAWHEPRARPILFGPEESGALQLTMAMQRLGLLSPEGLRVMATAWNGTRFLGQQTPTTAEALLQNMLEQMEAERLIPDHAEEADVIMLYKRWQLPMYELQITPTIQTIEELRETQARMLNNEIGGW